MTIIDYTCQAILMLTGFFSLYYMKSQLPQIRMRGAMIGLAGEPFWLATAAINQQWGVMILALVYAVNWYLVLDSNRRAIA